MAAALRLGVGLAFMSVALPAMRIPFVAPRAVRGRVWGTGLLAFAIPLALLFWGERSISAGLAGILNGTVPIWGFILGFFLTPGAEPISARKIAGLILGMVGVVAVFLPKAIGTDPSLLGAVAVGGMAVSYAGSVLANRSLFSKNPDLHPFTNLYQQLIAGGVTLLAISLIFEGPPRPSEWNPIGVVLFTELYLGAVSTSLAFMLFYRLIRAWGSVRASTVTYVIPIAALGLDLALNGSIPKMNEIFGVAAITAGVVILNLPRK